MIYFRFELINAVLLKTMIQGSVEVIDNTTNTTSSSCILPKKYVVNLINIFQMQSLSCLPCILGQITLFDFKSSILNFVSHTKFNSMRNDLSDDCLTVLPCTTMEIP